MNSTFLGALQYLMTVVATPAHPAEFARKCESERLAGLIKHVCAEAAR
jgi:hypothetical protein